MFPSTATSQKPVIQQQKNQSRKIHQPHKLIQDQPRLIKERKKDKTLPLLGLEMEEKKSRERNENVLAEVS